VDKVALGQAFFEYFGFPCQFSFHQLLHIHHHLSSEAGTIGQLVATYQVDLASPHPQETKKKAYAITILCLCIPLSLLGDASVKRYRCKEYKRNNIRNVGDLVFYAVGAVSKESRRLVLPRTYCNTFCMLHGQGINKSGAMEQWWNND
jgi:hypothetical protein